MKLFRTYLVLALAMLITLSASGINISLHKCCGSVRSFSLFGEARKCEMNKVGESCSKKAKHNVKRDSCCSNPKISFTPAPDAISPTTKTEIKQNEQNFDVLFFYTLIKSWFGTTETENNVEKPSPGLFIIEALILLLQQFRI